MASRPSQQPPGHPGVPRKDKQLALAEWGQDSPGHWTRRTRQWPTLAAGEGSDDHSTGAPRPGQ